jgi:hypothetical protein
MAAGLVFAAVGGCAPEKPSPPMEQTGGGLAIGLSTTPSPPHTGDDVVDLHVTDQSTNAPIGDANVTVEAESVTPRLPGSPVSGRAQGNGVYQAPVVLPIQTEYDILVQVARPGKPAANVTFRIDVEH